MKLITQLKNTDVDHTSCFFPLCNQMCLKHLFFYWLYLIVTKLLCSLQEDSLRWHTFSSFKKPSCFWHPIKNVFFCFILVFLPYESYLTISSKLWLPAYCHGASQAIWVPQKPINPRRSKVFTVGHLNQFGKDFGCCRRNPTGMPFKEPNIISCIAAQRYGGQSFLNHLTRITMAVKCNIYIICLNNPESLGKIVLLFLWPQTFVMQMRRCLGKMRFLIDQGS